MEKLNVNQKTHKKAKANKNPIKVIYFSNPKKVRASPAEFRAVVQELTGRDSDVADLSNYPSIDDTLAAPESTSGAAGDLPHLPPDPVVDRIADERKLVATSFEELDEAYTPQMMDNFPGLTSSAMYYEPLGDGF